MVCDVLEPPAVVQSKRCSICGESKPITAYSPDPGKPYNVDARCRHCCARVGRLRNAQERHARLPRVLGHLTGESLLASILGSLRTRYDGRFTPMVADLRLQLASSDGVDRTEALLTLLACRELALAMIATPLDPEELPAMLADIPEAEFAKMLAARARIVARRSKPST